MAADRAEESEVESSPVKKKRVTKKNGWFPLQRAPDFVSVSLNRVTEAEAMNENYMTTFGLNDWQPAEFNFADRPKKSPQKTLKSRKVPSSDPKSRLVEMGTQTSPGLAQKSRGRPKKTSTWTSTSLLLSGFYVGFTLGCYTVLIDADVWLHCNNKEITTLIGCSY